MSSAKQKEGLQRQVQELRDKYAQHELIGEVCSGINFQRKGFQKLVNQICEGTVSEVVILHKNRLFIFGYDLLEHICQRFHTKLLVHDKQKENECQSPEEGLSQDLLAIINVFVARNNGHHAVRDKKKSWRKQKQ